MIVLLNAGKQNLNASLMSFNTCSSDCTDSVHCQVGLVSQDRVFVSRYLRLGDRTATLSHLNRNDESVGERV